MTANFVYHDVHSNFHHQCLKIDNLFLYNIGCHGCQRGKSAAATVVSLASVSCAKRTIF